MAQDDEPPWDKEEATLLAGMLSECAGVYEFTSMLQAAKGNAATGELMHQHANGAQSDAMYLLAWQHIYEGNEPRRYGDFMPYIEERTDQKLLELRSMLELANAEGFEEDVNKCLALADLQAEIVALLDSDMEPLEYSDAVRQLDGQQ